jgi:hypothetical protein
MPAADRVGRALKREPLPKPPAVVSLDSARAGGRSPRGAQGSPGGAVRRCGGAEGGARSGSGGHVDICIPALTGAVARLAVRE